MMERFSRLRNRWRDALELVAPASTLLIATGIMLLLGLATQTVFAQDRVHSFGEVLVTDTTTPGGTIRIAVEDGGNAQYTVYLPGLSRDRLKLTYDTRSGYHIGLLKVPTAAPEQGYCTVRLINASQLEEDHRVRLLDPTKTVDDP